MPRQRVELTSTPYTILGHGKWVEVMEAAGAKVSDDVRRATKSPREPSHTYGECANGPWRCKVHRREAQRKAEQRKAQRREAQRARQVAENAAKMNMVHEAGIKAKTRGMS